MMAIHLHNMNQSTLVSFFTHTPSLFQNAMCTCSTTFAVSCARFHRATMQQDGACLTNVFQCHPICHADRYTLFHPTPISEIWYFLVSWKSLIPVEACLKQSCLSMVKQDCLGWWKTFQSFLPLVKRGYLTSFTFPQPLHAYWTWWPHTFLVYQCTEIGGWSGLDCPWVPLVSMWVLVCVTRMPKQSSFHNQRMGYCITSSDSMKER